VSLFIGAIVRVIAVHHPALSWFVGQKYEVTGLMDSQSWVRPLDLVPRKTRQGIVMVRPNHETLFGLDQLEVCQR